MLSYHVSLSSVHIQGTFWISWIISKFYMQPLSSIWADMVPFFYTIRLYYSKVFCEWCAMVGERAEDQKSCTKIPRCMEFFLLVSSHNVLCLLICTKFVWVIRLSLLHTSALLHLSFCHYNSWLFSRLYCCLCCVTSSQERFLKLFTVFLSPNLIYSSPSIR